jgi:basic amino acid/polyamine antiporter, APA family
MAQATVEKQPELKRVMGPGLLLLFIIGDILGTGVYALTGDVAAEVGGAAWLPFLVAFLIAMVTAFSYLELVTKYPQAAGAALYAHKAFGVHFVTFLVAFIVMCSGITSASTASRFFASNFFKGFGFDWGTGGVVTVALLFMVSRRRRQPQGCRRERQAQRGVDHRRDHRPDAGHLRRLLGVHPGR